MSSNSLKVSIQTTLDPSRLIQFKGSANNTLSVTKAWINPADTYSESVTIGLILIKMVFLILQRKIMGTAPQSAGEPVS